MTKQIARKCFAGAGSVAVLAAAWIGATMLRPPVSKAFTLIEMPATVFPEVSAAAGQNIMVCANNMAGDGSVRALIGLLDVADSTRFVPGTTPTAVSLDVNKGSCALLLPAVQTTVNADIIAIRTGIPAIFFQTGTQAHGGGGGAGKTFNASVQLVGPNGAITVLPPAFSANLLLPAVQLP